MDCPLSSRSLVDASRSWDQIGESLGMSCQTAWEYDTRETRRALDEIVAGSELDEDEAMRIATERSVGSDAGTGPRPPERLGCEWCSMPTC